jgi:hypothetical protein
MCIGGWGRFGDLCWERMESCLGDIIYIGGQVLGWAGDKDIVGIGIKFGLRGRRFDVDLVCR